MLIGVLALQGDVREHLATLSQLHVETREVRSRRDLEGLDGLIIPGGESTTISKLLDIFDLRSAIIDFAASGKGIFGTCAGMIMLATNVVDSASGQQSLGLMDITVRRNAFGSQLDSFEQNVVFAGASAKVAFIRAPLVESFGPNVEVLSRLENGSVIAVKQGKLLATSFHPEITGEVAIHRYFLGMLG